MIKQTHEKAKPKYINNSQVHRPVVQAPAQQEPLPAMAPATEPRPSTAYVERHGQLVKRQIDELTKTEREDLEQAARRAEYVVINGIYSIYG